MFESSAVYLRNELVDDWKTLGERINREQGGDQFSMKFNGRRIGGPTRSWCTQVSRDTLLCP